MEPLLRRYFSSSAAAAIAASAVAAVAIAVRGITDPSAAAAAAAILQKPTDPGNDGLDERLASADQYGDAAGYPSPAGPSPPPPSSSLNSLFCASRNCT